MHTNNAAAPPLLPATATIRQLPGAWLMTTPGCWQNPGPRSLCLCTLTIPVFGVLGFPA